MIGTLRIVGEPLTSPIAHNLARLIPRILPKQALLVCTTNASCSMLASSITSETVSDACEDDFWGHIRVGLQITCLCDILLLPFRSGGLGRQVQKKVDAKQQKSFLLACVDQTMSENVHIDLSLYR